MRRTRGWPLRRRAAARACALALAALATACTARAQGPAPGLYRSVYPHSTPELVEDNVIVLDTVGGARRGWYYGTSDDFDEAREGYLPGFFVADMEELTLSGDTLTFTLRPARMFTAPVPLRYRSAREVPAGVLAPWEAPVREPARRYRATVQADRITVETPFGPRVFTRSGEQPPSESPTTPATPRG